jgi:DNA-binding SARP family transcriptional activator
MSQLRIYLLGEFRLEIGDIPISSVKSERLQSLLAYLLLHAQSPQPRKQLAFQFWPDSTERQAHTNLRKLLFQLRQALPDAGSVLLQDHVQIQWRAQADDFLDVSALQRLLAQTQKANRGHNSPSNHALFTEITQLYQGELLPGCHDEWIIPLRQQLHRDVM